MVRGRLSSGIGVGAPFILLGILGWSLIRAPIGSVLAAPALPGTPADQLAVAATKVEDVTTKGGSGFTFTVVSRSVLYARDGGPLIEVPDPTDPARSLGTASEYDLGASIATGIATPDGYFLQMYAGPATRADAPDFGKAAPTLAALVKNRTTWRNDGDGWYPTDAPPGIGLDSATIALLPALLREATGPVAKDARIVEGALAAVVEAGGNIARAPGLMAVDAASFTELAAPLSFRS